MTADRIGKQSARLRVFAPIRPKTVRTTVTEETLMLKRDPRNVSLVAIEPTEGTTWI